MWRRVNREDLAHSNPLLGREGGDLGSLIWRVYEDYEVQELDDGTRYVQVAGKGTPHQAPSIDKYDPVTDTPYLFLEFARLVESRSPEEALYDFVYRYGVPGFSHEVSGGGNALQLSVPHRYHDDKGGTLDSIEYIWGFAWEFNQALLLYESATSRDQRKMEQVLYTHTEDLEERKRNAKARAVAKGHSWLDMLVSGATYQLMEYASAALRSYCYPVISSPDLIMRGSEYEAPVIAPDILSRGWGTRNLLGAMGLQFYWLITSGGELNRCKYCGRIISHAPSVPGSRLTEDRKTRSDKTFCDSRCRQNYHYHNRIKPTK
jgi:hypothetical protein